MSPRILAIPVHWASCLAADLAAVEETLQENLPAAVVVDNLLEDSHLGDTDMT